jgi:hypothetical protein
MNDIQQPVEQSSTLQPTPPEPQPENQPPTLISPSNTKLMYAVIALIAVITAGGVLWWQGRDSGAPISSPTVSVTTVPTTTPPDPTADWQTYSKPNETFGIQYRVKYPQDWEVSQEVTDFIFSIQDKNGATLNIETPPLGFGVSGAESIITIDNKQAINISDTGQSVIHFSDKSLENIQIVYRYPDDKKTYYINLLDQILSTFKFTQ